MESFLRILWREVSDSTVSDPDGDAREAIRGLIEKIVVTLVPTGGKRMEPQLDLDGALAGILGLSLDGAGKSVSGGWVARRFQLDGVKLHGRRWSMRFLGCPAATASRVAFR